MSVTSRVMVRYMPGHFAPYTHKVTLHVEVDDERFTFRYVDPHGRNLIPQHTAELIRSVVESFPPSELRLSPSTARATEVSLVIEGHRFIAVNDQGVTVRSRFLTEGFRRRFERALAPVPPSPEDPSFDASI